MIASKKSRFLAHILDRIIVLSIFSFTNLLYDIKNANPVVLVVFHDLIQLVLFIYFFFSDSLPNGQSFGKKLLRIAVVHKKTNRNCSVLQSFIRNVFFAVPFSGLIESISVLSNADGRRIGDKLAGTIVIQKITRE